MAGRILLRRLRIVGPVALVVALLALLAGLYAVNWRPSLAHFPVQGIDVGASHGPIDWFEVKAAPDVRFAYVRATVGADRRDRRFVANWKGVFEAGIPHGAIHAFSLCQLAADQAGNFVSQVPRAPGQLPMALDLDFRPDCTARPDRDVVLIEIANFLRPVEAHVGRVAILRISPAFEARYRVSGALRRPLWTVQPFFPPSDYDRPWRMWQASSFRRIPGAANAVNWNVLAP